MEKYITADRIANSVMQDVRFKGYHILVEGVKDIKVYTKFFRREQVRLMQTYGKYKLREAFEILSSRNFTNKLAIRDADFLRIKGNVKYDEGYQEDIYPTDGHDSEVMMLSVNTLEDMLSVIIDPQSQNAFEESLGESFKDRLLKLAYIIGCLRLANKKFSLGLSFKPARQDGNRLKFKRFICERNFTIDSTQMIHIVTEYSKNRDIDVSPKELIKSKLDEVLDQNHDCLEVINGHDIAEISCYLASVGIRSKNHTFQHPDYLEEALALSFDREKFRKTQLFEKIDNWQEKNQIAGLFSL